MNFSTIRTAVIIVFSFSIFNFGEAITQEERSRVVLLKAVKENLARRAFGSSSGWRQVRVEAPASHYLGGAGFNNFKLKPLITRSVL